MKKVLFGSAAAILAVVGFSAFKTTSKVALYWFPKTDLVSNSIPKTSLLSTASFASFASYQFVNGDPFTGCSGTVHYCDVAFTASQLQFDTHGNPIGIVGSVTPADFKIQP